MVAAQLFEELPLEAAMPKLLPNSANGRFLAAAELAARSAAPELQAAIWLYVDDLAKSHTISQGIDGPIGAYWHGIMHRREGDFSNSKYWFRQARGIDLGIEGYEPSQFADQVEAVNGTDRERSCGDATQRVEGSVYVLYEGRRG
jgi:hypothetical protein